MHGNPGDRFLVMEKKSRSKYGWRTKMQEVLPKRSADQCFDVLTSKEARLIRPVVSTVSVPSLTSLSYSPSPPVLPSLRTSGDFYLLARSTVCVCFLPISSGHQVRWTCQPGSHRRKVTQDFSSTFFCGACLNFSREKDSAIPFPRRS